MNLLKKVLLILYRVIWYLPMGFCVLFWTYYFTHLRPYSGSYSIEEFILIAFAAAFFAFCACCAFILLRIGFKKMPFWWIDFGFFIAGSLFAFLTFQSKTFIYFMD